MHSLLEGGYELQCPIGEGTHGQVFLACIEDREVAIKVVMQKLGACANEITAMQSCSGENVLSLLDVVQGCDSTALVLELGSQDLFGYLESTEGGHLNEALAKDIFSQLARGIAHCHSLGWVHRDIKLENVVRVGPNTFKLIDFNLASPVNAALEVAGTPRYAAPEILCQKQGDPKLADCWSLGIVLFALTTGQFPWCLAHNKRDVHFAQYVAGKPPWPAHLSTELKDLLSRMLSSVNRRPQVSELLRHPWLCTAPVVRPKKRKLDTDCCAVAGAVSRVKREGTAGTGACA